MRATHARTLQPAALASVSFGFLSALARHGAYCPNSVPTWLLSAPKCTIPENSELRSDNLSCVAEEAARAALGSCVSEAPGNELGAEPRRDKARKAGIERKLPSSTSNCNGREFPELGLPEIKGSSTKATVRLLARRRLAKATSGLAVPPYHRSDEQKNRSGGGQSLFPY